MINKETYNFIEDLTIESVEDIFYALTEEVGELATALHVKNGTKKRELDEPATSEVIDIILVAIEMYIKLGGTPEELDEVSKTKLEKWAKSFENIKDIPPQWPWMNPKLPVLQAIPENGIEVDHNGFPTDWVKYSILVERLDMKGSQYYYCSGQKCQGYINGIPHGENINTIKASYRCIRCGWKLR